MRPILLALLLVPSVALAQTLSLQVSQTSAVAVGSGACDTSLPVTWTASAVGATPCSPLTVWSTTDDTCGDSKGDSDRQVGESVAQGTWNTQGSGTVNLAVDDLPIFSETAADGGTCGAAIDQTVHLCASFTTATIGVGFGCGVSEQTTHTTSDVTVRYDAVDPPAPTLAPVTPLDSALGIHFTANGNDASDLAWVHVEMKPSDSDTWNEVAKFAASKGSSTVENLQNGTPYDARIWVEDEVGNPSPRSNVEQGTPVKTAGFWASYVQGGGNVGCASGEASGLALALLWVAGLLILGRRHG